MADWGALGEAHNCNPTASPGMAAAALQALEGSGEASQKGGEEQCRLGTLGGKEHCPRHGVGLMHSCMYHWAEGGRDLPASRNIHLLQPRRL